MTKRILVSVIGVPFLLWVLFWAPESVLPVACSLLAMIGIYEGIWATGLVKHKGVLVLSLVYGGQFPFSLYLAEDYGVPMVFFYVFALFVFALRSHYTLTLEKLGGAFFLTIIIPTFLCSFLRILHTSPEYGRLYLLVPFLAAYGSDTCALFAGMFFGKHKLAPEISPKKTVEGAIGGFLGGIIFCVLYGVVVQTTMDRSVSFVALAIYGALGSVVGQMGDLSFSYIKRQYKIKDYGNLLPGHGGVLDRFDSVLFAAPLMETLIFLIPAFF